MKRTVCSNIYHCKTKRFFCLNQKRLKTTSVLRRFESDIKLLETEKARVFAIGGGWWELKKIVEKTSRLILMSGALFFFLYTQNQLKCVYIYMEKILPPIRLPSIACTFFLSSIACTCLCIIQTNEIGVSVRRWRFSKRHISRFGS